MNGSQSTEKSKALENKQEDRRGGVSEGLGVLKLIGEMLRVFSETRSDCEALSTNK